MGDVSEGGGPETVVLPKQKAWLWTTFKINDNASDYKAYFANPKNEGTLWKQMARK